MLTIHDFIPVHVLCDWIISTIRCKVAVGGLDHAQIYRFSAQPFLVVEMTVYDKMCPSINNTSHARTIEKQHVLFLLKQSPNTQDLCWGGMRHHRMIANNLVYNRLVCLSVLFNKPPAIFKFGDVPIHVNDSVFVFVCNVLHAVCHCIRKHCVSYGHGAVTQKANASVAFFGGIRIHTTSVNNHIGSFEINVYPKTILGLVKHRDTNVIELIVCFFVDRVLLELQKQRKFFGVDVCYRTFLALIQESVVGEKKLVGVPRAFVGSFCANLNVVLRKVGRDRILLKHRRYERSHICGRDGARGVAFDYYCVCYQVFVGDQGCKLDSVFSANFSAFDKTGECTTYGSVYMGSWCQSGCAGCVVSVVLVYHTPRQGVLVYGGYFTRCFASMTSYTQLVNMIQSMHFVTEAQRITVDTMYDAIMESKLVYATKEDKIDSDVPTKDARRWKITIRSIITQLMVFGYCLCRVVRVKKNKDELDTDLSEIRCEIADGSKIVPRWHPETLSYTFTGVLSMTELDPTQGWTVLELHMPYAREDGTLIPMSGAARAFELSRMLMELEYNYIERDRLNTSATVVTNKAYNHHDLTHTTHSTSLFAGLTSSMDGAAWAKKYEDVLKHLGELSKKSAEDNRRRYEEARQTSSKRTRYTAPSSLLMQLPVDEGRAGTELSTRMGPPEYITRYTDIRSEIMWMFGVPPHIRGHKSTSERALSADRMMQKINSDWENRVIDMIDLIQVALTDMSEKILDNGLHIKIARRMSAFTLERLGPMFKTKEYIRLLSETHHVDESVFDPKHVAMIQEGEQDKTDNRKANAHDMTGGNPAQTDAAKTVAHVKKHL